MIFSISLAALAVLGVFWLLWIKPSRDQLQLAEQKGVASIPGYEGFNAKINRKIQLRKATERGDWKQIETALAQGVSIEENIGDCTALMTAAQFGKIEVLQKLLANGAKTETQELYGNTALLFAARYGQNQALEVLLEQGANLQAKNRRELNALDLALVGRHEETYELLKARKLEPNLFQAITANDETQLRKLLAQRADVNAVYVSGNPQAHRQEMSGLHFSVGSSWGGAANSAPIYPAFNHSTPLMGALTLQQWNTAELLLKHGAKVDQADKDGRTALMHLAQNGDMEAVQFLMAHNADVNYQGHTSLTALELAAGSGKMEVVKYLLSQSAQVDDKTFASLKYASKETRTLVEPLLREAQAKNRSKEKK